MSEYGPAGEHPHRWIKASAGTGKTFQLAKRYLELAACPEVEPDTILATTFTRAAAAEIKNRVLQDAAKGVLGDVEGSATFDNASALLDKLIGSLPRLQIRTLDSLYASIVRGVSDLVEVPADARLLEAGEEESLLQDAIETAALEEPQKILATLETISAGGHGVRVIASIERAVKDVLEIAQRTKPSAWEWPLMEGPAKAEVAAAAEALNRLSEPPVKPGVKKGASALFSRVEPDGSMSDEACKKVLSTTFASAVLGDRVFGKKELPDELIAPARVIIDAAIASNARSLHVRTAATYELVELIKPKLIEIKRRLGVVSFHDLVSVLDPEKLDREGYLDELWFRLDGSIKHMLLDEFQDTNWAEWRALQPIVEEVVACGLGEHSLFVVGDLKQSIYGWRGGEPAFLEKLPTSCGPPFVDFIKESLVESWRSGQPVIDAVNEVFESIESNVAVVGASAGGAASFGEWFETHSTAKKELGGEAMLEILPEPVEGEHADQVMAREAARAAKELRRTAARGSVAVLVRRNKAVAMIVEELRKLDVPAAGQGSGSLIDTDAATLILQALRWAHSPLDTLAAYDVARSPLAEFIGLQQHGADESVSREVCEDKSAWLRSEFARLGVATLVDRWRRKLNNSLNGREQMRLRQLVEFFEGLSDKPRSLGELVDLALQARVEDPAGDGVTVMTIHQAKGLQFDAVVVADLAQAMGLKTDKFVWESPDPPTEKIDRLCVRFDKNSIPLAAIPAHEDALLRVVRESLCGLYVALTRAKRTLLMQVPPPKLASGKKVQENASSLQSAAGILRTALASDIAIDEFEPGIVRRFGEPVTPTTEVPVPPTFSTQSTLRLVDGSGSKRRRRSTPPSADNSKRWPSLDLDRSMAKLRGDAMHAALQTITWLEGEPLSRVELEEAMSRAAPRVAPTLVGQWCDDLQASLASDSIAAIFRKPASDPRVLCEASFAGPSTGGLEVAIVDRIAIAADGSSAVIYDFKTNQAKLSKADLLERYAEQLDRYRAIVATSLRIPPASVATWIVDLDEHVTINASP